MGYNECSPVVLAATISALMPGAYALLAIAQAKIPVAHNSTKHPAVQCWSHITPPRRCHFFTPIRCSKKKKKKNHYPSIRDIRPTPAVHCRSHVACFASPSYPLVVWHSTVTTLRSPPTLRSPLYVITTRRHRRALLPR